MCRSFQNQRLTGCPCRGATSSCSQSSLREAVTSPLLLMPLALNEPSSLHETLPLGGPKMVPPLLLLLLLPPEKPYHCSSIMQHSAAMRRSLRWPPSSGTCSALALLLPAGWCPSSSPASKPSWGGTACKVSEARVDKGVYDL